MPAPRRRTPLPASLSIGNFLEPTQITTVEQLKKFIAAQAATLTSISFISTERDAMHVLGILGDLKTLVTSFHSTPLVGRLDEAARKQLDDIALMIMTPEALPFTLPDSKGQEARIRKSAFELLLQANAIDPRTHNSRLGFHEMVCDVTFNMLSSDHVKDDVKKAFVQTLLEHPRIKEIAPLLMPILEKLDKTPPHTDYDGRPYDNHWAGDALVTLYDISRPDIPVSRTRGTKPTRAPR